jgi:hypothetical protein
MLFQQAINNGAGKVMDLGGQKKKRDGPLWMEWKKQFRSGTFAFRRHFIRAGGTSIAGLPDSISPSPLSGVRLVDCAGHDAVPIRANRLIGIRGIEPSAARKRSPVISGTPHSYYCRMESRASLDRTSDVKRGRDNLRTLSSKAGGSSASPRTAPRVTAFSSAVNSAAGFLGGISLGWFSGALRDRFERTSSSSSLAILLTSSIASSRRRTSSETSRYSRSSAAASAIASFRCSFASFNDASASDTRCSCQLRS